MARQLDSLEFVGSIRNSIQVLHNKYLYNKHDGIIYRCQTQSYQSYTCVEMIFSCVRII